ncbi:glycosyltransferase family 4 protein [Mucilaginibacter agri]|uniref:Glycosyltransferase n=1 Tax=Mucilaginibacter agri TaxID=2695265 RepID=A0A965ZLT1_9SPHI|nr:glycosyltransferase family 4 protein [Mucilaginibacter agri]NCD72402.1 glycosyltransferase [Mucilaginibacter agri]
MKILLINTFYYPKFVGGAEISVQVLAEGLVDRGHDVYVLCFGPEESVYKVNGVVVISILQKNIYSTYFEKKRSKLQKTVHHLIDSINPFYGITLANILAKIQPDVVHTNNIQGFSPMIWPVIKFLKYPVVHTIRDYYLLCHRNNMYNNNCVCEKLCADCNATHQIKKLFLPFPDSVIGISDFVLSKHDKLFPAKTSRSVIYNGVKFNSRPGRVTDEKPSNDKMLTLGYLGRISPDKGAGYLVDELLACSERTRKGVRVLMAGNGDTDYVNALKLLTANLNVQFVGVVKPNEFLKLIDVLIVPSLWMEPFGRTVIEALAAGVPVCIAESGGLTELHDEKCTWLFKTDVRCLTSLIEKIAADKELVANKRLHSVNYAKKFQQKYYVENYDNVYRELLIAKTREQF